MNSLIGGTSLHTSIAVRDAVLQPAGPERSRMKKARNITSIFSVPAKSVV